MTNPKKQPKKGTVTVEILKPFHIGIDKPVYYKPGITEVEKELAAMFIAKGLAGKSKLEIKN